MGMRISGRFMNSSSCENFRYSLIDKTRRNYLVNARLSTAFLCLVSRSTSIGLFIRRLCRRRFGLFLKPDLLNKFCLLCEILWIEHKDT